MKAIRRMISALLVLAMVTGMVPGQVFAELTTATEAVVETTAATEAVTEPTEEITEVTKEFVVTEDPANAEAGVWSYSTYTLDGETVASIDKYRGSGTNVKVPSSILGYPVKRIGYQAFYGNTSVESVVIPEGVTELQGTTNAQYGCFYGCTKLTSITLPQSLTTIGSCAFYNCSALLEINLPDRLESIGGCAFWNCNSITELEIPNELKTIGDGALNGTNITRLELPDSITSIHLTGLSEKLKYIRWTAGIPVIEYNRFWNFTALETVILPEGIIELEDGQGYGCFAHCTSLTNITLPQSLTKIGTSAFYNCSTLPEINLPKELESIGDNAFHGCNNLTELEFPNGLKTVGVNALYETGITKLELPDSITSIDLNGLSTQLTYIRWTTGIPVIEYNRFWNFTKLETVILPEGITELEDGQSYGCFAHCTSLRNITLPQSLTKIGASAFYNCSTLQEINLPKELESIGDNAFNGCNNLMELEFPDGLKTVGVNALYETGITRLELPDSITSIDLNGLSTQLTYIRWTTGIPVIEYNRFWNFTRLETVILPEGITELEDGQSYGCFAHGTSLTNITLPQSLTKIGSYAFYNCSALADIYYAGTDAQWENLLCSTNNVDNPILYDENLRVYCNWVIESEDPEEHRVSYGAETNISTEGFTSLEKYYLNNYFTDWKKAYEDFITKVNACLQEFSGSEQESRESIIQREADRMRDHDQDQNTYSKYLSGQLVGYESQAYDALSSFFYDHVSTEVPDISSVDLSKDLSGLTLVNTLRDSMKGDSKSYFYGNVTISITVNRILSVNFGSMTILDNKGTSKVADDVSRVITICSDLDEISKALRSYIGELQELSLNTNLNVAKAVYKDILGKPLAKLTSDFLSKQVSGIEKKQRIVLREKLREMGVGENLIQTLDQNKSTLEECYSFYTWTKECIELGNQEEIGKTLTRIMSLEFEDTTISEKVVKKAMKALQNANQKMQRAFREYLDGTLVENEQGFWRWLFGCPVSISVYNASGEKIGYVGEDDIWYTDDISITEVGGVKEIISFTEEELAFTVTATDYGTMSCMFEQYDETFTPVGRLNYYNIVLEPEQTFHVSVPETLAEETETAAITSGVEVIYPDEYISAEDSAGVNISCSSITEDGITGGTVSGTGTYIRGDSVILRATPYDGFRFVGWFDGEHLMKADSIYEFPAREDCEITARFYKEKPIQIDLDADVGGSAIGSGRYDSGETVTLIAIPKSGYSFAGWYIGEELISTDAEYNFQAAENLNLRAAFLPNGGNGDVNKDGTVDSKDAVYLLWCTMFPEQCPIPAGADFDGSGQVTPADAEYLLWHILFPELYPL